MMNKTQLTTRPLNHLATYSRLFPGAWDAVDEMRASRGKDLPNWPDTCFVPIAGTLSWVTRGIGQTALMRLPLQQQTDYGHAAAALAGLSAWRISKSIYSFDTELYKALTRTNLTGDLPGDILERLPQWGLYIPLPGDHHDSLKAPLHGAFVWLENDAHTHTNELRFLLDTNNEAGEPALVNLTLHLTGNLEDGSKAAVKRSLNISGQVLSVEQMESITKTQATLLEPLVNLVLYLCSEEPDYGGQAAPSNPESKRVKGGSRLFPAHAPTVWEVGARIGASIRAGQTATTVAGAENAGERNSPRPHVRAAHWHGYWTGPRTGEQKLIVKWIPPTLVAAKDTDEDFPAVIRDVKLR